LASKPFAGGSKKENEKKRNLGKKKQENREGADVTPFAA